MANKQIKCINCKKDVPQKRGDRVQQFCGHQCAAQHNYPKTRKKTGPTPATCHPDKPVTGKGLCKNCYYKKYRQREDKKAAYKITIRRSALKNSFGITVEQWDKMYELQKGVCPICNNKLHTWNNPEGRRCANVDHDHKTKRVRGLLCYFCNKHRVSSNTLETAKKVVTYLESDFDGRVI